MGISSCPATWPHWRCMGCVLTCSCVRQPPLSTVPDPADNVMQRSLPANGVSRRDRVSPTPIFHALERRLNAGSHRIISVSRSGGDQQSERFAILSGPQQRVAGGIYTARYLRSRAPSRFSHFPFLLHSRRKIPLLVSSYHNADAIHTATLIRHPLY